MAVTGSALPGPALPAAGSSFYTAMRILPRRRREAMYAVYAFCRAVDDIADGEGPRGERFAALARWREDIDKLFQGAPPPSVADLAEPTQSFGLQRRDFHAVIDGMAMDVEGDIRAPDWHTLDHYCDCVASAVGRLSVRIFGLQSPVGDELAHHLGRALQLTNILRDLDEDAASGRLYLPREALERAGVRIEERSPAAIVADAKIAGACDEVAARALQHFLQARRIMAACPRAAVRAPQLMRAAYSDILRRLIARGWAAPRAPAKLRKISMLGAVLRYGIL